MLTKTRSQVGVESWHRRIADIRNDSKFLGQKTKRRMWHNRMDVVEKYDTAMSHRYMTEKRTRAINTFHRQGYLNKVRSGAGV